METGPVTLWFRPTRRHQWVAVAECGSRREAVGQIGCGGRHNGEWLIRDTAAGRPQRGQTTEAK